jgi:hypothetical protein
MIRICENKTSTLELDEQSLLKQFEEIISQNTDRILNQISIPAESFFEKMMWILIPFILGIVVDQLHLWYSRKNLSNQREKSLKTSLDPYVGNYICSQKNLTNPPVTIEMTVSRIGNKLLISGNPSNQIGRLEGTIYMAEPDFIQGEGRYSHENVGDGRERFGHMRVFLKDGQIMSNSEYVAPQNQIMYDGFVWTKIMP